MIKFTIITCTFNAANVVKRTLDSVLEQDYPYVEHLILDGLSKDSTLFLVKEYKHISDNSGRKHNVILHSEHDNGLYDAMNKGINLATGDYLVFLNAGDVFPSFNTLSLIANSVKDGKLPGVIYGDTDIVDNDGKFLCHRRLSPPEHLSWRSFKQGMLVCHQAFYARTDIAKRTPYNLNYHFSADVDWCIRVMKEAEQEQLPLHNVHAVIVDYLNGGMTTANHKASLKERFHVMSAHYGLFSTLISHAWFAVRAVIKH